jgi:hypothetical protein
VITYTQGGANTVVVQSHTGIAWPDDVKNKYKNLKTATEKNTKQWLDVEDGIFFFLVTKNRKVHGMDAGISHP